MTVMHIMENQEKNPSCLERPKKWLKKAREGIKRSFESSKKPHNKKKKGRKNKVSDHPVVKHLPKPTCSFENDSSDIGESESGLFGSDFTARNIPGKNHTFLNSKSDFNRKSAEENMIVPLKDIRTQYIGQTNQFGDLFENIKVGVVSILVFQESMKGEKYDFVNALIALVNPDLSKDGKVLFKLFTAKEAFDLICGKEAKIAVPAGLNGMLKTVSSSPEMRLVKSGLVAESLSTSLKKLEPQSIFSEGKTSTHYMKNNISTLITLMKSTDDVNTLNDLTDFLRGEAGIDTFTTVADNLIRTEGIYPNTLIVSLEEFGLILKSYGDASKLEVLWRIKNRIEVSFRISLVETKMFEDAMRQYLIETCKLTSTNIYPKYCRMFISLPIIKYSLLHQLDEKDRRHIESCISSLKEKHSVSAKIVFKELFKCFSNPGEF